MKIIEGKTKILTPVEIYLALAKDDITAKDGAKKHVLPGKAELANQVTCNMFEILKRGNIQLAYIAKHGPKTFWTQKCEMIKVEVVVRRVAKGSYCKRNTHVVDGSRLKRLVVEFYYKTTDCKIGEYQLPCNDPLMEFNETRKLWSVYRPDKPKAQGFICVLSRSMTKRESQKLYRRLSRCKTIACKAFEVLEKAWQRLDATLQDIKFEFGMLPNGDIVMADVVDLDSWRLDWYGQQVSKQGYRDDDPLAKVLSTYQLGAMLSNLLVRL